MGTITSSGKRPSDAELEIINKMLEENMSHVFNQAKDQDDINRMISINKTMGKLALELIDEQAKIKDLQELTNDNTLEIAKCNEIVGEKIKELTILRDETKELVVKYPTLIEEATKFTTLIATKCEVLKQIKCGSNDERTDLENTTFYKTANSLERCGF